MHPTSPFDLNRAAIGQHEGGYIDGVGVAMLGQTGARHMVHGAAGIGPCHLELDDAGTEMVAAAGATTRSTQWSTAGTIGQRSRAGGRSSTVPRAAAATENGFNAPHALGPPSDARASTKGLSRTTPTQTGALLVGAPGLVVGDEIRAAAACRQRTAAGATTQQTRNQVMGRIECRQRSYACVNHPIPRALYLSFAAVLRRAFACSWLSKLQLPTQALLERDDLTLRAIIDGSAINVEARRNRITSFILPIPGHRARARRRGALVQEDTDLLCEPVPDMNGSLLGARRNVDIESAPLGHGRRRHPTI